MYLRTYLSGPVANGLWENRTIVFIFFLGVAEMTNNGCYTYSTDDLSISGEV